MNQADMIAQIALSVTDKPIPTAAEILAALNRAYEAGFAQGVIQGAEHTAKVMDRVMLAMSRP